MDIGKIERIAEWGEIGLGKVDSINVGDAEFLPYKDDFFEAICTSPTYGNRMADHFEAKDGSKRNTYRYAIGRALDEENTGKMQWGKKYREKTRTHLERSEPSFEARRDAYSKYQKPYKER